MIDYYLKKGYTLEWIEARIKAIINRKKLIKTWSGMKTSEYKIYKEIRKESLRDNMTDIEVALTDLGEIVTRELVKKHKLYGLEENKEIARRGGKIAKNTRKII